MPRQYSRPYTSYSIVQLDSYYITELISLLNILLLMVDAPRVCYYFNQDFLLKPDPILASIMLFLSYSWFICFDLKEYCTY